MSAPFSSKRHRTAPGRTSVGDRTDIGQRPDGHRAATERTSGSDRTDIGQQPLQVFRGTSLAAYRDQP